MKKINLFLTILAAAAGFTNCAKVDLVENKEAGNGGTVVYATTDAVTKTTLASDYKVLWSTGDQIKFIKDGASSTTYTFTLSSGSGTSNGTFTYGETPVEGTYTVYYPATYDGTNWPAQTYVSATDISGAPMKATATVGSDGSVSDITFANEGGILRYTVKGSKTIKSIKVKSASPALDVTLDCGTSGVALTAEGTVFNIALPAGEYSNATLTFTATDNTVATKTASTFTVTKNKVSLATFEATALSFLPGVALPGLFTVGKGADGTAGTADDVQVRFSQGNLVATINASGTPTAWKFSAHQYDCLGAGGANKTIGSAAGDVDLFGWSTSTNGGTSTADNYGIKTSTMGSFYPGDFYDWGKAVGDGNTWRTLSKDEWTYLFNNHSKKWATVNGVKGYVIAPDGFDGTLSDTYADDAALAANNLVFLPAAGARSGSSVSSVGINSRYWSSTALDETYAYVVYFNSSDVNPDYAPCRADGSSVRLITESK